MSKLPIESGTVLPGVLQARVDLRDFFAAQAMQSCLLAALGSDDERAINMVAKTAYAMADWMLERRADDAAELGRQKRLAAMGQELVDLAASGANWECPFCNGVVSGPHDQGGIADIGECSLAAFMREAKAADTLPAGPPDADVDPTTPAEQPARMVGADRGAKDEGEST